jgi:hypothetical protein
VVEQVDQPFVWNVGARGTAAHTHLFTPEPEPVQVTTGYAVPGEIDAAAQLTEPPLFYHTGPDGRLVALSDQRAYEEYERAMTAARERSFALLKDWLSPKQRADFEEHRMFCVIGERTGRRYVITSGYSNNVWRLDESGKPDAQLCFGPRKVHLGDILLAQKLTLETDEEEALGVANVSHGYGLWALSFAIDLPPPGRLRHFRNRLSFSRLFTSRGY